MPLFHSYMGNKFVFVVANILIMKCDWNCTHGGAIFINDKNIEF